MAKKLETPEHKTTFVIGPIGARLEADWLLEFIIEPLMEQHPEFKVLRADKIAVPGRIDAQVINHLHDAELLSRTSPGTIQMPFTKSAFGT